MKDIDQILFIQQLEHELENQLNETLEVFQNLPESTLLQPPSTGGWSIAQCIEHLNTYSAFYLPKMQKALSNSAVFRQGYTFKHTWLGNHFIKMMDITQGNKKYKAIRKHQPDAIDNPYRVIAEFIQHQEDLLKLLKQAQGKNLRKSTLPTSISSLLRINVGDAFQFVVTHNRRHLEQAKRNLIKSI